MVKGEVYTDGKKTFENALKVADCENDFIDFKSNGQKDQIYHDEDDCTTENETGKWTFDESSNQLTVIDDIDEYKMLFEVASITKSELKLKLLVEDGSAVPKNMKVFIYFKK